MALSKRFSLSSSFPNTGLVWQLTKRDVETRYRNSVLGAFWLLGQPFLQLLIYAFVFQVVLRTKWGISTNSGNNIPFGLILFVGIVLHSLIADCLVRGPHLIISNESYVKRVIFPLEILPLVNVLSASVGVLFGLIILVLPTLYFLGKIPLTTLLVPIPLFSLMLFTAGVGWFLGSLGVFFRDLGQFTSSLAQILLFTAPICYPATMVPASFRWLLDINPLTIPVESIRSMIFFGQLGNFKSIVIYAGISWFVALAGYLFFVRTKAGFADAI